MLKPTRIKTNIMPLNIEYLGNGSYYYNYDIQSQLVTIPQDLTENPIDELQYNFVQVKLKGKANYADCVQAIIRKYITQNQEFDLINSMNKFTLGIDINRKAKTDYEEYLELLDTIKSKVKIDFE